MPNTDFAISTRTKPNRQDAKLKPADYNRFFEAGRDAAAIGELDAQAAHGLAPSTEAQRAAWDAGRASLRFDPLFT